MKVYGKNVFNELRKTPEKIKKVYLSPNNNDDVFEFLKTNKILFEIKDNRLLDKLVKGNHQGIVMEINDFVYSSLEELFILEHLVILDHLNDPHNFGAIIRTCEALGVKGIIIPKNRSVSVNDTVMKVSAGALNNVSISLVSNLNNVIKVLKDNGYFIYGADMDGRCYYENKYPSKWVLIIGSEGEGLHHLVKENCDEIIKIPMEGTINSLNASVSAAIILSEMVRK